MSLIGHWNSEEDSALQGLSLEAQIIYLRGIRRFHEGDGWAGRKRRINRAALIEVCHFLPDAYSRKAETQPTWRQVDRRLDELERAGLIVRHPNLVFFLALAGTGSIRPNLGGTLDGTLDGTHQTQQRRGFPATGGTLGGTLGGTTSTYSSSSSSTYLLRGDENSVQGGDEERAVDQCGVFSMHDRWWPDEARMERALVQSGYDIAWLRRRDWICEFIFYWQARGDIALTALRWEDKLRKHLRATAAQVERADVDSVLGNVVRFPRST